MAAHPTAPGTAWFVPAVKDESSLIPLAVPFLQSGTGVGAIGFIAAMAVASTIVDVSPFSTNGAAVTIIAPVVVWLAFVVIG